MLAVFHQIVEQVDLGGVGDAQQRGIERIERDLAHIAEVRLRILDIDGANEIAARETPPLVALDAKPDNDNAHDAANRTSLRAR